MEVDLIGYIASKGVPITNYPSPHVRYARSVYLSFKRDSRFKLVHQLMSGGCATGGRGRAVAPRRGPVRDRYFVAANVRRVIQRFLRDYMGDRFEVHVAPVVLACSLTRAYTSACCYVAVPNL